MTDKRVSNITTYDGVNSSFYTFGKLKRYWHYYHTSSGDLTHDKIINLALENNESHYGAVKRCNTCGWRIEVEEECIATRNGGNMGGHHWYYHIWCYPASNGKAVKNTSRDEDGALELPVMGDPKDYSPDESNTYDLFRILEQDQTKLCGNCRWKIYTKYEKYTRAGGHYYHGFCYKVKKDRHTKDDQ